MAKKSVVILGAGFGGLRAAIDIAKSLRRLKLLDRYDVVLVDRNDCHLYVPLLYKVAASPDANEEKTCTYDITALIKGLPIRFVNAEIASLDLASGTIQLKTVAATPENVHADYLVIALGSETNFFGIPGMQENALQLKTLESALQIRAAITAAFARGGQTGVQPGAAEVKIVTGGAGPNGIELASEIRLWADHAQKKNPNLRVSVSIVEAMPGMLNGLDTRAAKIAAKRLEKLGIEVKTNMKITGVSANEITVDGAAPIPFDVFIWTGGVKTPNLLTQLPIVKDQRGKPMAKNDMACVPGTPDLKLAPMIYGIGDSVCFMDPKTGRAVPAVAHVAILEGQIAARNVIAEIKRSELGGHEFLASVYRPGDYPWVVPAGENWAVAKIGPFVFSGWLAWQFSHLVELYYLSSIMSPLRAWNTWRRM
jgi:NADH:ubiquinone reductase (H+-translocating)